VQVSGASQYKEERKQWNVGFDYLRGKTTYSLGYTDSKENDYHATTASFGISQDLFGDLTTISMGFSKGADTVRRTTTDPNNAAARIVDPTFKEDVDKWSYRVGVTQILTKSFIAMVGLETITDEGYLNNPYRAFRYIDPENNQNFRLATEKYPHTRTSNAVSINGRYFLPWRAAAFGSYRFFTDTWGIRADTGEIGYAHPLKNTPWTFEASYRYYQQDHADFYSDLFPRIDFQNFMGRDKELSTFNSQTVHIGATYEFAKEGWSFIKKGTFNVFYDRMQFSYDDFRDARAVGTIAGQEPLYEYGANVYQVFVSIWF
jgi:hypothetical protein